MDMAMPPVIEVRTVGKAELDDFYYWWEKVRIFVNGEMVAEGIYGGAPEDNERKRTYKWVDEAIKAIGEKLGVEVRFTNMAKCEICGRTDCDDYEHGRD